MSDWISQAEEYVTDFVEEVTHDVDTAVASMFPTPEEHASEYGKPIPVHIERDESELVSPEFCSLMTFSVPQVGGAGGAQGWVQILPHRYHRYKARLILPAPFTNAILYVATIRDRLTGGQLTPTGLGATAGTQLTGLIALPCNVAGQVYEYTAQRPLFAAWGGTYATTPTISLSVSDESYGDVK